MKLNEETKGAGSSGKLKLPKLKFDKNNRILLFFKRNLKKMVFLLILIFAGNTAFQVYQALQTVDSAKSSAQTQTFDTVSQMDISNSISVTGTIEANDSRTLSTLVSNTEVLTVSVKVGDYVEVGDPICTFDTSNIEKNIAKLQRQIAVNNAKATLELAKANTQVAWAMEDLADNQDDAQYDVNSAIRNYQSQENAVQDAIDNLEAKERALDDAEDAYDDYKDSQTVSDEDDDEKDADDYKDAIKDAQAAVDSAQRSLENAQNSLQGTIDDYNKTLDNISDQTRTDSRTISTNQASVISTQLNNMLTNDDAEQQIEDYQDSLSDYVVTAPIAGLVTSVSVEVGDKYEEKSTICVIQDDTSYLVSGTVDQYDISEIAEGMSCVIKTDATGDDELTGTLTFVSPVPESSSSSSSSSTGTSSSSSSSTNYPIEISIDGRDDRLRIGMTAETSVLTESKKGVLAVPYDAVEEDADGTSYINVAVDTSDMKTMAEGLSGNAAGGGDNKNMRGAKSEHGQEKENSSSASPLVKWICKTFFKTDIDQSTEETTQVMTKKVNVETGLETDYYTEISSNEIQVGDEVLIPNSISTSSGSDSNNDQKGGMMGGGGGAPGGDGAPGGGGPGGGF